VIQRNAERMMKEGQQIFRFDTFGSEAFWGDALQLVLRWRMISSQSRNVPRSDLMIFRAGALAEDRGHCRSITLE